MLSRWVRLEAAIVSLLGIGVVVAFERSFASNVIWLNREELLSSRFVFVGWLVFTLGLFLVLVGIFTPRFLTERGHRYFVLLIGPLAIALGVLATIAAYEYRVHTDVGPANPLLPSDRLPVPLFLFSNEVAFHVIAAVVAVVIVTIIARSSSYEAAV